MKNIVLIGFMGSGKTVVGRLLADRLGYKFIDTDKIIEERIGKTISDIFNDEGERYFREIESNIVKELSELSGHVISTGGGIVLNQDNLTCLKKSGLTVWLKASPESIHKRVVSESHRPLLNVKDPLKKIKRLLNLREKFYSKADISINTDDLDIEKVVENIIDVYHKGEN